MVARTEEILGEVISKQDQAIHERAIAALQHHYAHGDSGFLNRLVAEMPKSKKKEALLLWILTYTKAEWDHANQSFSRRTALPDQKLEQANATPFWTYKQKQIQRRHVSGNSFDPDLFFDRVISEVRKNIGLIPSSRITKMMGELQQVLSLKQSLERQQQIGN